MEQLEKDVSEIKEALLGNAYGSEGFVKRLQKVEEYQMKDKKQKWTLAGIGLAVGFALKIIFK